MSRSKIDSTFLVHNNKQKFQKRCRSDMQGMLGHGTATTAKSSTNSSQSGRFFCHAMCLPLVWSSALSCRRHDGSSWLCPVQPSGKARRSAAATRASFQLGSGEFLCSNRLRVHVQMASGGGTSGRTFTCMRGHRAARGILLLGTNTQSFALHRHRHRFEIDTEIDTDIDTKCQTNSKSKS